MSSAPIAIQFIRFPGVIPGDLRFRFGAEIPGPKTRTMRLRRQLDLFPMELAVASATTGNLEAWRRIIGGHHG